MASTPFPAPLRPQTGSLSWPSAATIRPNLASQTSPSPPAPTSCRCIPPASTPAQPTASLFASTAAISPPQDRKSTRLNSSHTVISYAVFCLKKKKSLDLCSRLGCPLCRCSQHAMVPTRSAGAGVGLLGSETYGSLTDGEVTHAVR